MEIAKQLSHIAEQAHTHVMSETDDWFDQVSVSKNMKTLKGSVQEFKKAAVESHQLNQRLTGLYEDIGHVLNRYYEIDEALDEVHEPGHLDAVGDEDSDDLTLRKKAKLLTKKRKEQYMNGRLGMIIDGTGHKWKIVRKQKQELEKLGYDTYMIFVDTSLEVAQKRNQERDRILPPKLLEDSWKGVQKNRGAFKSLFKNNFIEIQNNETLNEIGRAHV